MSRTVRVDIDWRLSGRMRRSIDLEVPDNITDAGLDNFIDEALNTTDDHNPDPDAFDAEIEAFIERWDIVVPAPPAQLVGQLDILGGEVTA